MFWCVHRVWNLSLLRLPSLGRRRPCYKELLAHKSSGQIETSFTTCCGPHTRAMSGACCLSLPTLFPPNLIDKLSLPPSGPSRPMINQPSLTTSKHWGVRRPAGPGTRPGSRLAAAAQSNKLKSLRDILWLEYGSEKSEITFAPVRKLSWVVICCLTSSNCPALVHGTELSARTASPPPSGHTATITYNRGLGNEKQ